jgi:cytochrome c-type biogenesis protein CcmH/NrfG
LAIIYMQQGRFEDAATNLRRVLTLQPENGDAWALLGSVLKDSEHIDEAADALRHAISLEPDQPSLHIQLASIEITKGNREQAAAERKIAAELSRAANQHQRANFALRSARALLAEGKLDMAILQLKNAVDAEPTLAEPHALLAEAYAKQGKAAAAALERNEAEKRAKNITP